MRKKIANIQDPYFSNFKCVPPILMTVLFYSVLSLSLSLSLSSDHSNFYNQTGEEVDTR